MSMFFSKAGRKRPLITLVNQICGKDLSSCGDKSSHRQRQWSWIASESFSSSSTDFQGIQNKKHDNNYRTRRSYSGQRVDDTTREIPMSMSSRQLLWEEMSAETRKLARSIVSHRSDIYGDGNFDGIDTGGDVDKRSDQREVHPRVAISRAITLMESKHPYKKKQGDLLLTYLLSLPSSVPKLPQNNKENPDPTSIPMDTLRVGFAGPPGAGKSSMMEAFGMKLLNENSDLKLAVVCVDPSSTKSGGSILGDKTRMTELSRQVDRALVRPSSNSGILGGLAAYTDDVVRLLGCAGYPLVFVETVGLGQSEIEVAQSVDVMVLLIPPSGGDELQGVKKGIVEIANILVVTKTDGALEGAARQTAADYQSALRVLHQSSSSSISSTCDDGQRGMWMPPVVKTSSVTELGLDNLWHAILRYQDHLVQSREWEEQRRRQAKYWMWKQFSRSMQMKMQEDPVLREKANQLERKMLDGFLTPRVAAEILMDEVFNFVK